MRLPLYTLVVNSHQQDDQAGQSHTCKGTFKTGSDCLPTRLVGGEALAVINHFYREGRRTNKTFKYL